MPGKIGVKIKAGRNLPVMDRGSFTTDAFVELRLGNVTHKTDVCRKSLNPTWNTDWYRFEVDDAELQDEPLQIRLMDYDTYSANDAIGKVNISLNPLCLENSGPAAHGKGTVLSGWIPVFDTMHGIRGEINIIVKVDLFSDANKFRQSSCGIPFFHSPCVPYGYRAQVIHGFVEELVVNDDPEYQWIDKIRTPRATNEARQVVFLKLSGQVQRKMGLKAINLGANAVVGYTQCFDLEGDVGVVARGVGTAVTLIKDTSQPPSASDAAFIEDVTLKYLEFLTCAGGISPIRTSPQYIANLSDAPNFAIFSLEKDLFGEVALMHNLIRQEDERGEKSRKKLRHRMLRLAHSSRSIFNEKYTTLLRRIEPKIPEHATTHSLSSIETRNYSNRESLRSLHEMREHTRRRTSSCRQAAQSHAILRSTSESSTVRPVTSTSLSLAKRDSINAIVCEFQDKTRSVPNIISLEDEDVDLQKNEFLAYFNRDTESKNRSNEADVDVDNCQEQWIKPGETLSQEKSLPNLKPKRNTLFQELKSFSKRLQQMIQLPKKDNTKNNNRNHADILFNLQTLERKPYYSSQPEFLNEYDFVNDAIASNNRTTRRAISFINLKNEDDNDVLPTVIPLIKPLLTICPSTPTPTETNFILLNKKLQEVEIVDDEHTSICSTPARTNSQISLHKNPTIFDFSIHNVNKINSSSITNSFNKNNQNSLLDPCFSVTSSSIDNTPQQPPPPPLQQQQRSSRTIDNQAITGITTNATIAATTTTNMSSNLFANNTTENIGMKQRNIATSPNNSNHLKLSPSPSKSGISNGTVAASDSTSTSTASTATTMIPKEVGEICRRSSDSDLSVTPKGNSICVASERLVAATAMMRLTQQTVSSKATGTDSLDMLEYPFLTMTKYPVGFILHLGATVAARSVKLLERVPNPDEPEVRDSWWTELRMEIRSHARSLGCNVVLGYAETTTISDDVCVLSATGTAAVINMVFNRSVSQTDIFKASAPGGVPTTMEERDIISNAGDLSKESMAGINSNNQAGKKYGFPMLNVPRNSCSMCHIPYSLSSIPFNVKLKKCAICHKGRVPDVLLSTLELPEYVQVTGRGCFMQAQVVRAKKDLRSELNAKEISDGLPFLEYELHRVLINKLKAKGMNAIFGLKTQVAIGERMIALIATGTALFLRALPVPQVPKIVAGNSWTDKQKLNELQKKLQETFERNQEIYQLKCMDPDLAQTSNTTDKQSDTDDTDDDDEMNEIDLNCGNKQLCVLEVDDIEDLEIISLLMEPYPPEGFHVVNTQQVPGNGNELEAVKNMQMFAQVWRARLDVGSNSNTFPKHFQRLLQTIYFKLRNMIPCAICDLRFRLDLPETDQIQLLVTGIALGLNDSNKIKYRRKAAVANHNETNEFHLQQQTATQTQSSNNKRTLQEEDYIFPLDEDHMVDTPTPTSNTIPPFGMSSFKMRKTSPNRLGVPKSATLPANNRSLSLRDRYGVDISPLSFIPGGRIEKYLGNLNFFFIRESTSVRENGGISGFVHGFITELLAVVRAHIAALGGNAMVSFYMTELILFDNQHKNQGQCLISIGGDAVYVSYYSDD